MATPLTEQWVVRKDAASPWEYHDVPLGTKARRVRQGFEHLGRYGTAFEMHPATTLPRDKRAATVLPGDKIIYICGGRSKSIEHGVVTVIGKNCVYVQHGAKAAHTDPMTGIMRPAHAGWTVRLRSHQFLKD